MVLYVILPAYLSKCIVYTMTDFSSALVTVSDVMINEQTICIVERDGLIENALNDI